MRQAFEEFSKLLELRLASKVPTTEDSVRYTLFAAMLSNGIAAEEVVLEYPHPAIDRGQIDTWLPNYQGRPVSIEFKYDRDPPSGRNQPKTQKAGSWHIGSYCEGGGFGAAIKALCLDALTEASIFYGTCIDAREDACLTGVVGLAHFETPKLEIIFRQIQQTTKAKYLASFSEIISYNLIREWYPGLSLEFADALFDAVPKAHFEQLARWVSKDPNHRNGWPDLTLVKNGRLKFVEVKTTDRLHHSQLVTIPALVREIGADVSVLKLVSTNNSFKPNLFCGPG